MSNKIQSIKDVADLLNFLSGSSSLSARVQQECKDAEKVLGAKPAITIQLSNPVPPAVPTAPATPHVILVAKPWRHGTTQVAISTGNVFTDMARWLDQQNGSSIIVEIEAVERNISNKVYDVLYRYKS